jgi:hypothetical protein
MKKINNFITEKLKINSKSKINSGDTYTFNLNDYKETIELPFLLYIIADEEYIKICRIDDVLENGKHHIRLFDEKDKVVTVLRETNVINLFKKQKAVMGTIYNYNGNAYYRNETFKYKEANL